MLVGRAIGGEELALARKVGCRVMGLPCRPGPAVLWEGFQFIGGTREVLGGKHSGGGYHEELIIGHREVGTCKLGLCFLEHVDVLGNVLCLSLVTKHLGWEVDKFAWVEATAVGIKMIKQLFCGEVGVE